jgi:hypothetical protein
MPNRHIIPCRARWFGAWDTSTIKKCSVQLRFLDRCIMVSYKKSYGNHASVKRRASLMTKSTLTFYPRCSNAPGLLLQRPFSCPGLIEFGPYEDTKTCRVMEVHIWSHIWQLIWWGKESQKTILSQQKDSCHSRSEKVFLFGPLKEPNQLTEIIALPVNSIMMPSLSLYWRSNMDLLYFIRFQEPRFSRCIRTHLICSKVTRQNQAPLSLWYCEMFAEDLM